MIQSRPVGHHPRVDEKLQAAVLLHPMEESVKDSGGDRFDSAAKELSNLIGPLKRSRATAAQFTPRSFFILPTDRRAGGGCLQRRQSMSYLWRGRQLQDHRPGLGCSEIPGTHMHRRCTECGFSWGSKPSVSWPPLDDDDTLRWGAG
jgi:hypothetical protein